MSDVKKEKTIKNGENERMGKNGGKSSTFVIECLLHLELNFLKKTVVGWMDCWIGGGKSRFKKEKERETHTDKVFHWQRDINRQLNRNAKKTKKKYY